jgi:hypothetical protein
MKRKPKIARDLAKPALGVFAVASVLLLSMAIDEIQIAGFGPLWTVQLREVLLVWFFILSVLGPTRKRVALGLTLALALGALISSNSAFAGRSGFFSVVGILAVLIPARCLGLKVSSEYVPAVGWRPSILQLFAITAAFAGVFTLGRLTYQDGDSLIAEFAWPLLLGAMLSCSGLVLLSNYQLVSRLLMTCLIVAPVGFVLAQPHRVDMELAAAVIAELGVALGWSLVVFGISHSLRWMRVSRLSAAEHAATAPSSALESSSVIMAYVNRNL